jgi:predicted DNA-binding transcriptional regulator YafY
MRDRLNAPIEYDALHRGYCYTKPNYRIPAGFSGAEDLLALGMAKSILSLYRKTPLYSAARNLLDCITAPLAAEGKGSSPAKAEWYENRIVVPQVPSAPVSPELWSPITMGLRENRIVQFDYQGVWGGEYKPRRVRPYQLMFDPGVWYLYGYAEERKAIRIFSLQRIKNLSLTDEIFILPRNFDYRSVNSGTFFGVFAGQEKFQFCIGFYDDSALWVQERQWALDQKIKITEDGVIVSFSSTQYVKVLEWVLSRGCTAQPFAPKELVDEWRWHIKEMGKLGNSHVYG